MCDARGVRRGGPLICGIVAAGFICAPPVDARTYEVNRTADTAPNGCANQGCTLREAVIAANGRSGADTIELRGGQTYRIDIPGTGEDAALTGDPQPAVGCGWAFRGAEWLVSATAPALQGNGRMSRALSAYRRSLRFIENHDRMARREALAQPMNPIQRMIVGAANVDPDIRRRVYLFGMRAMPVSGLLNPRVIARSYLATRGRQRRIAD